MPDTIGHYRVVRKLGEGGMGVVYAAEDERLSRQVAIKMIRNAGADEQARRRFWREARAAAGVSHPNICQIYEVGEEGGQPYLVMELLEGESLGDRLQRGPLAVSEAGSVALAMLSALEALHKRELVHRDLKPSNVFLTTHGPKLLDFGLARSFQAISGPDAPTFGDLTQPGTVLGTPRYMPPEQLQGLPVGPAADLFATGTILFEMLTGKRAFEGDSVMAVFHAVLYEPLPTLGDAPEMAHLNRIIQRAMARKPEERYPHAAAMAEELRGAITSPHAVVTPPPRRNTRLIVLPFRMLRPDADTDFLAFSLPDAITNSLSGLQSLVVRSSIAASRFAGAALDLKTIAAEADVDAVLTGTLLRAGDRLRVNTQLVEAPAGTLLWSQTSQVALGDIFQLQDELVTRIVESLSVPLTTRDHRILKHDVPASPEGYEYYLRANRIGRDLSQIGTARDLYLRSVDLDPRYAPAWAGLARCQWVLAKWSASAEVDPAQAEQVFQRAFELNPDLPLAHNLYARLECDFGRANQALVRLLQRAKFTGSDPELFTGLVHVCRYCGLLEASVAAYQRALKIDPHAATSVEYTYFAIGDTENALRTSTDANMIKSMTLALTGRMPEALELARRAEIQLGASVLADYATSFRAFAEGKREESIQSADRLMALKFNDLEGSYFLARQYAQVGDLPRALRAFKRASEGFYCYPFFVRDPWLDPLRDHPEFAGLLEGVRGMHEQAKKAFADAGGERIL